MTPTVRDMVGFYLKQNGYDGLCMDDCGCDKEDLAPCSECMLVCQAAYKVKYNPEIHGFGAEAGIGDWIYTTEKPKEEAGGG